MSGGQNPVVLAFIGAPFMFSCYWRYRTFNMKSIEQAIAYSSIVYVSIAVGYSFTNFPNLHPFFINYSTIILCTTLFVVLGIGALQALKEADNDSNGCGCIMVPITLISIPITYAIFFGPLAIFISYFGQLYITPISIIIVFVIFGVINAFLGQITAGFSLSASAASFFLHGNLDYIYLWKDIFEFFEINSLPVKILMIVVTCFFGASDLLSLLVARLKQ